MKPYTPPRCQIIVLSSFSLLAASGVNPNLGLTEGSPAPLKRLHPLFVKYDDLEDDIKTNLKDGNYAINYRSLEMMGIDYSFLVGTYKGEDDLCSCFYCQLMNYAGYIMYYNIYDILEFFLIQIRQKEDGVYHYQLSQEVRKKMPTFCKLLANANHNDKNPTYGLPMITFLDAESKYTLLTCLFKYENINDDTFDKIHASFFKILEQLTKEMDEAGFLNQSYAKVLKKCLKTLFIARHFFSLP